MEQNVASKTEKKPLTPGQLRVRRSKRQRLLRALLQVLFFFAMPGAFATGFSGVKHLFQWIGSGDVLQLDSFVLVLIALVGFTILFGRFFCGFACAFGSLGDFIYWVSGLIQKKLLRRKKQISLPEKALRVGQFAKYVVLGAIVLLCAFGIYGSLSGWSPWDIFSRLTAYQLPPSGYTLGIVLFVLILAGMAFQKRFFCQFLCPMGAVFALLPVLPFGSLHRNSKNCIRGCSACQKQCPVGVKLAKDGTRSGECIACEACVDICPKGNISRFDLKVQPMRIISILVKAALFFILGVLLGLCRFSF